MRAPFCAALLLVAGVFSASDMRAAGEKAKATPSFCQEDKEAGFADGGSNFCAPTAISNGIIYLAQHRGLTALAPSAEHSDQIALIKELAVEMATDPKEGTNPDKIVTGLRHYVESKGLHIKRMEVASWRKLGAANKSCLVGTKPDLDWMRQAANDPDCIEVFNVGWYRQAQVGYLRNSGDWVTVVGARTGMDFAIHNPLLESEAQRQNRAVTLTPLTADFKTVNAAGQSTGNMNGYYRVDGRGLPFGGKTAAAVLDSVIIFSVQK